MPYDSEPWCEWKSKLPGESSRMSGRVTVCRAGHPAAHAARLTQGLENETNPKHRERALRVFPRHPRSVCLRPAPLRDEAGDAEEVLLAAFEADANAGEIQSGKYPA